ncbi:hypothetical protein LINGRAPRIM_LOCUS562 [Linum grandiflorum]
MGTRRNYKVAHLEDDEEVDQLYGRIPPLEPITPSIQVNQVQPISRQQQEREVEHAMQGVSAYVSPTTGDTYYKGSSRPPNE